MPTQPVLPPPCEIPDSYTVVSIRHERHDTTPVTVIRTQPAEPLHLGGEHVTLVIRSDDQTVYGLTHQTVQPNAPLPDADTARTIAFDFLHAMDAAYTAGLTEQWIDRHDETITTRDGPATIAGVKVKTRHADGRYAWVIVGPHNQVITYERDITWDAANSRRKTQMWLHDRWIHAHDTHAPDLAAPAARSK